MNTLRYPLLVIALFSLFKLNAQVKKGFSLLKKKDYEAAFQAFQKDWDSPNKQIIARYGYMKTKLEMPPSLTPDVYFEGITLANETNELYKALDIKEKNALNKKYNITSSSFLQTSNSFSSKIIKYIEKSGDKATLDAYNKLQPNPPKALIPRLQALNKKLSQEKPLPETEVLENTPKEVAQKKITPTTKPFENPNPSIFTMPPLVKKELPAGAIYTVVQGINTNRDEFLPMISPDGNTLYFTGSYGSFRTNPENVIFSTKQADGTWGKPRVLEELSTNVLNEAIVSLSIDGNSLLLFINGKIHICNKELKGWSKPKLLEFKTAFDWIGVSSISRNGEIIIFEATLKKMTESIPDLYIAKKEANGEWGDPVMLSPVINTSGKERSPFLHSDFKTLYFSSDGHSTMGKLDVFKTTRLDDSWQNWSEPVNLGKTINSVADDWGFYITASGERAYFSTQLNGKDQDIVEILLPKEAQPEKQQIITGKIEVNDQEITEISVIDANTQAVLQKVTPQPDGNYSFSVSQNVNYKIITDHKPSITKLSEGKSIALRNVLFEHNKYELLPESKITLESISAEVIKLAWHLEISGHTDNTGSHAINEKLSQQRADSVRAYLIQLGCDPNKLTAKGYGSQQAIANNDTEEGRHQNRRVEIKVISK